MVRVKGEHPKESLVQEPTNEMVGPRFNLSSLRDFNHMMKCISPRCGNQHTLAGKGGFLRTPDGAPLSRELMAKPGHHSLSTKTLGCGIQRGTRLSVSISWLEDSGQVFLAT